MDKVYKKQTIVSQEDLDNIISVFSVQSESHHEEEMVEFVDQFVANLMARDGSIFYNNDEYGNLFITKGVLGEGEFYPCIAAHLDTVHSFKEGYEVVSEAKDGRMILQAYSTKVLDKLDFGDYSEFMKLVKVGANLDDIIDKVGNDSDIWEFVWHLEDSGYIDIDWAKSTITRVYDVKRKPVGGCGDDKGGVWLALDLLAKTDVIKVVLFSNEEVGCLGSTGCELDWFKDCGYVIQGDRKNSGDVIHEDLCSNDFLKTLEDTGRSFGYKSAIGLFTDVTTLVERGVGISCVNISVGYYNPHVDNEYTVAEELINARNYVQSIIKITNKNQYPYISTLKSYKYNNWDRGYTFGYGSKNEWDYDFNTSVSDDVCDIHNDDYNDYVVDAYCDICNPIIKAPAHGVYICEYCGTELKERKHSRNCSHCMSVKIKLY